MSQVLEIITTDKTNGELSLPQGAQDKIVDFLTEMKQENSRNWASIATIASQTGVSDMYTRTVIKRLCDSQIVEAGYQKDSKKHFFRLKDNQ